MNFYFVILPVTPFHPNLLFCIQYVQHSTVNTVHKVEIVGIYLGTNARRDPAHVKYTYFDREHGDSMMDRRSGHIQCVAYFQSPTWNCSSSNVFNMPLAASLSYQGGGWVGWGWRIQSVDLMLLKEKWKREEIVCMQPCECIFLRVLQIWKKKKKISCSIVMTQWSNLYLF